MARELRPLSAECLKHQRGASIYLGNSKAANESRQNIYPGDPSIFILHVG